MQVSSKEFAGIRVAVSTGCRRVIDAASSKLSHFIRQSGCIQTADKQIGILTTSMTKIHVLVAIITLYSYIQLQLPLQNFSIMYYIFMYLCYSCSIRY